jgi:HlyD family secretion protein
MRRFVVLLLLAGLAAGGILFARQSSSSTPTDVGYRTASPTRGSIIASVNATGTVSPTNTVIVGSQLSGQVIEILADYNTEVKAGQVLARLNTDQVRAKLDAARADLAQSRAQKGILAAQLLKTKSDIEKARATAADIRAQSQRAETLLADAQKTFDRQTELQSRGIATEVTLQTSKTARDTARSTRESAEAQMRSSEAAITSLEADVSISEAQSLSVDAVIQQKEAQVRQIEVDIANSEVRAPVNGVVIQRNVELGQPVAASLQAPTLFLVAENLRNIEIQANVDESDVGRVQPGQEVTFTVNAYQGRSFAGKVRMVRLGSQNVQNVVIYTTIITVENPNLELRPGMTATLRILTERKEDVIRVPNAALRWRPPAAIADVKPEPAVASGLNSVPDAAGPFADRAGRNQNGGGGQGGNGQGGAARQFVERLKTELALTPAQIQQLDAIVAELRPIVADVQSLEQPQRREKMQAYRKALVERLEPLLTPEQKTRYAAFRAQQGEAQRARAETSAGAPSGIPGRIFVLEGGLPRAIEVKLGASDGAQTEIIGNNVTTDMRLITGGGPKLESRGTSGGFRPPF